MAGLHSTQAKRYVRIAQMAGLGLGVMAVALWAMDVPGLSRTLPAKPVIKSDGSADIKPVVQVARIASEDVLGMKDRLELGVKRPAAAAPPPEQTKPPEVVTTTGPVWKYLGPITEAKRVLALVSLDGAQKIIAQGATLSMTTPAAEGRPESESYKATVVRIDPEYIDIEESGKKRRIELESRAAKVAWVKNMPVNAPGAPTAPNMAGMSPEARQRLAAQGIDPGAAERARLLASQQGAGRNRAVATPGVVTAPQAGMTDAAMAATSSRGALDERKAKALKSKFKEDQVQRDDVGSPN